ncbi:hypothetical protein AB0D11_47925 [Streptomyces monashensis]|uniref:hypothetical protein n=1 Tax=Streptomyces monashensis TaxID=1678012 RepID=UPI0033FD3FBF
MSHTDRGAHYKAAAFAEVCRRRGIRRSRAASGAQSRLELFRWLAYYNRRRRPSAFGNLTPVDFELQLVSPRTLSLVA